MEKVSFNLILSGVHVITAIVSSKLNIFNVLKLLFFRLVFFPHLMYNEIN